jgi:hypothetical protein
VETKVVEPLGGSKNFHQLFYGRLAHGYPRPTLKHFFLHINTSLKQLRINTIIAILLYAIHGGGNGQETYGQRQSYGLCGKNVRKG